MAHNLQGIPANFTRIQGIPAFRDFTIHDPLYFVRDSVLGLNFVNSPPFHDFEKKIQKKIPPQKNHNLIFLEIVLEKFQSFIYF